MRRVLIVAPDPLIGDFVEKGLRARRFETTVVDDIPWASDALTRFDVVVIDDRVLARAEPRLVAALAADADKPLIVLTGNGHTADTMAALGDTQADVISKPFRFSDLLSLIERRLGQ